MRHASIAALLLAVGCSDFTLVEPRHIDPMDRASLGVFVQVSERDSVTVDLFAEFRSGAGATVPSTLSVQGTALRPTDQGEGVWIYEWREVFPVTSAPRQLQVTTPSVQGATSSALSLVIPIARREDPMDVAVPFGEDLRLHVSPLTVPAPPLTDAALVWSVMLQQATAAYPGQALVSGKDAYPPELHFPWEWVELVSRDSLVGRFQAVVGYHAPGDAYDVSVQALSQVAWRIHISPKVP